MFALPSIVFLAASFAGYETKRPPFPLKGRDIVIDRIRLGRLRIQRPATEELGIHPLCFEVSRHQQCAHVSLRAVDHLPLKKGGDDT